MVGRPPRHLGRHPVEAQILEVKRVDQGIDHAYRIALIHPANKAFLKQRRLAPIRRFNEPLHQSPPQITRRHIPDSTFSRSQGHSLPRHHRAPAPTNVRYAWWSQPVAATLYPDRERWSVWRCEKDTFGGSLRQRRLSFGIAGSVASR